MNGNQAGERVWCGRVGGVTGQLFQECLSFGSADSQRAVGGWGWNWGPGEGDYLGQGRYFVQISQWYKQFKESLITQRMGIWRVCVRHCQRSTRGHLSHLEKGVSCH